MYSEFIINKNFAKGLSERYKNWKNLSFGFLIPKSDTSLLGDDSEFLNLDTIDFLNQEILGQLGEAVFCIVGCLAAFLAYTH